MAASNTVVARIGLDDKGFQEGVTKIQRSLKVVRSEFAVASSKLGDFGKSTEGLKLKSNSLNKQMELQKAKVQALTKSYKNSVDKKGEDAKATENLKIKLNYATAEMNKLEGELSDINKELKVQSSGFTKLGKSLEGIGSKMKSIGQGFSNVGKSLTMNVTTPIVAVGTGLLKLANDFESANNTIRIGTGATGEALQSLKEDFKAVYTSVNTNISDASQVIADLNTRTGLSGESLQELSTQMLKLAKITGEDINSLIPASTRMFQDAGLSVEEYAGALDYTFKVSQSTGIGVGKLQQLMTQFGGPLRQMGFEWKTAAVMLGKFEKEGVNTELVVGSLRIALSKMAREGISEPNKALAEMITRIKEAGTAGEANAMALEMFGARAGADMAAAIREGRLNLDELIASIKASPEIIEKAAKDTETVADKFAVLKNKMAVSLEPLGKKLLDAVEKAMPAIQKFITSITKIIERFTALSPVQQDMILKFGLIVAAIGPLLMVVGKLISVGGIIASTFGSISTAIGATSGATTAVSASFTSLIAPIALTVGAVAGLIAIFTTLYKNNEDFRNTVSKVWSEVKVIIGSVIQALKEMIQGFTAFATDIWSKYGDSIVNIISAAFEYVSAIVKTSLTVIKDLIKILTSLIKGDWQGAWEGIKNLTSNLWENINNISSSALNLLVNIVKLPLQAISDTVIGIWEGIKTVTSNVWNGIGKTIQGVINGVIKGMNVMIRALNKLSFNVPNWVPAIGGASFGFNIPQIKEVNWYAKGGIFSRPSVIGVGESGTEAVIPIDRLDELIAKAMEKVKGINNNQSGITVHIENFINNTTKDIEQLAYELEFYRQKSAMGRGGL